MSQELTKPKEVKTVVLELKKTASMIADGHADVHAIVQDFMMTMVSGHAWTLVYRWGKPGNGCKPVFAAQTKILSGGKKRVIQLHRYVMLCNQPTKDGTKRFVIPRDGNALNCVYDNLQIMSESEWETRTHRKHAGSDDLLTEAENRWVNEHSVEMGKSRGSLYREGIRLLIAQSEASRTDTDPFQD